MLYGPGNCDLPAHVFDVDRVEQLSQVISVDTEAGDVECAYQPMRLNYDRSQIETYKVRFATIYPIFGGADRPTLFHCYGRQSQ